MTPSTPSTPHRDGSSNALEVDFHAAALVAAAIVPGLGHVVRGERVRGIYAFIGVMTLFLTGLLAGGIDVIDRKEDKFWFMGQAFVGPITFGIDWYHQNKLKVVDNSLKNAARKGSKPTRSAYPTEGRDAKTGFAVPGGTPPNTKSIGKINELGMLSCTLAGMLNLIIIIDAGFPTRRRNRENA